MLNRRATAAQRTRFRRGDMLRNRTLAALPLAALLALAACDGAGGHNDADSETAGKGVDPVSRQDSATVGQQVPNAYPPVGSTSTTPPDSNPSPTTPGGVPPAGRDTGRATTAH
jgi:hypothetical protein